MPCTFHMVVVERICLNIKTLIFIVIGHFSHYCYLQLKCICLMEGEITAAVDVRHYWGVKGCLLGSHKEGFDSV